MGVGWTADETGVSQADDQRPGAGVWWTADRTGVSLAANRRPRAGLLEPLHSEGFRVTGQLGFGVAGQWKLELVTGTLETTSKRPPPLGF